MSAEEELARLERQVLGVTRIRDYLNGVEALRRMLAAQSPGIREAVLKLASPKLGRDLAAATSAAFDIGIRDALKVTGERLTVPEFSADGFTNAAVDTERKVADSLSKAKRLARVGADPAAVLSPVFESANQIERGVTTLVNRAGNAGATAVADTLGLPTVWVAETNACVTCLRYSGETSDPGAAFPAGLSYGKSSTVAEAVDYPPAHPNCRCTVEPLNDPEYAATLRREANRSVLRGFSLESEPMSVRVDAAQRLLDRGVDAPKSVIAYARNAVKRGEFTTRGRP